jgi:hypothetical protein
VAVGSPVRARATGLAILLVLGLMIVTRGLTPPAGGGLAFVHPSDLVLMLSELSLLDRTPALGRAVFASPRVLSSREPSGDRKMR